MPARPRSLRLDLIVTLAIILVMAAVSLSLATELLAQRRHRAQEIEHLRRHAKGLAAVLAPTLGTTGVAVRDASAEQLLRPSLGTLGIRAMEIVQATGAHRDSVVQVGMVPAAAPPLDPTGGPAVHEPGADAVVVDQPIPVFAPRRQGPTLWLRLHARTSAWSGPDPWREILPPALGIGLVFLVLGGLMLELQVLRPLSALREASAKVAAGDLQARAPEDGPAEIRALAHAFNSMTAALREQIERVASQRESLVRSEQLAQLGRIAAGIAHEVGNPLAAIAGYVELLLGRQDLPADERAVLERVAQQIERIQDLVGQLLTYSRPARDRPQALPLAAALGSLTSLLAHDDRLAGVELEVECEPGARAFVDPALLDQVVQNLLLNAARAAREAGEHPKVVLRARCEGDRCLLEVQDSGPGVDAGARPYLFEPFFTTAQAGAGTGLGLAICAELAQRMGAHLSCLPDGARPPLPGDGGPGATFLLDLPATGQGANASGSASRRA